MRGLDESQKTPSKPHPYLHGNFAPVYRTLPLTPCPYEGSIPEELAGGQYVRNGGNPVMNEDLGRDAHWFDGDGMLSGVLFRRGEGNSIQPEFVNQYVLTDVYLSSVTTTPSPRRPVLPSIATLINPASSLLNITLRILRTILLVILSHLPGSQHAIKKLSVANTGFVYHDGRALATCESGPPMRVSLPGLETVGWFDGRRAEGEPVLEEPSGEEVLGGNGLLSFMKKWTTAHPRVDPITKDLILFHSHFLAPFVNYSILPCTLNTAASPPRLVNAAVPGIKSPKMMHDFGVSLTHTVIMDLPISLNPWNLSRNQPAFSYNPEEKSRFGVFPRWQPSAVRWFETNPCCIFHTANTWDEVSLNPTSKASEVVAVNMLACRLTSPALIFGAGDIPTPIPKPSSSISKYEIEEEQCRLYYYRFDLSDPTKTSISHQFALSSIPFEFPSLRDDVSMSPARYIYGCSVSDRTFGAALGRAVKIDSLVKIDALALISRGIESPPKPITGCVDTRSVAEILASSSSSSSNPSSSPSSSSSSFDDDHDNDDDHIKIFKLPPGFYAQESRFVPRNNGTGEDDGWILSYVFDESQLDGFGDVKVGARSELWIINAKSMEEVVCKVKLPQRVPYGLHGNWFSEEDILGQRAVERVRKVFPTLSLSPISPSVELYEDDEHDGDAQGRTSGQRQHNLIMRFWMLVRKKVLDIIG